MLSKDNDDMKNLQSKVGNNSYNQDLVLRKHGSSNTKKLTDDIARIVLGLKAGKDLRSLQFHSIYSGLNQIFEGLQQNRSLIRFKLYKFQAKDDEEEEDDTEGFSSISNCLHDNITMKTLQLHFDDKQDKEQSSLNKQLLSQIFIDLEDNVGVTTLYLENWNKDTGVMNALCAMLKKNTTLLHLCLFHSIDKNLEIQDIEKISSSLEYNKSLRVLYLGTRSNIKINRDLLTSEIRNHLESLTRKRGISLIVRTDSKDYVFGSTRNMPVPPSSQWEVEDEVEVLCEEDQWEKGNIISVSSDYRYSILLKSGQIKLHCRAQLTRAGKDFQRYSIIPFVPSDDGNILSNQAELIANENIKENPIPHNVYEVGQQVEVRYYGDSEWNQATVLSISFPVSKSSTALLVLSVELGDDLHRSKEVVEMESFLVRPVDAIMYLPTPTELYYDAGVYKRGDYVEVNSRILHSDVANADEGSVTFEWKRGRLAIDKKNGTYDVRMENGKDALSVKASRLRHHFRSKDAADCRIKQSLEWKLVMVDKQDKDGTYIITYESGEQETGVSARRLMPSSRNQVRESAKIFGVKALSPTMNLELVQSKRLPPNRQIVDPESPSSKGKQNSSTHRRESSSSPTRRNSFEDNQSDKRLSNRRESTKSTKNSGANEESESLKLGEMVFDEENQDLESEKISNPRRESSSSRPRRESSSSRPRRESSSGRPRRESSSSPTRNPEDPIDPNAERNERRSSTSKRGESTEPDDKDRRSGRRESSSSRPRRESSSPPTRNPEDLIDTNAVRRERRSSTSKRGESTEPDDKDRRSGRRESSSSRPRRESSSSPTRNPEDPIDTNEERNERRSSTSKRGESAEPDDKDRRSGRRESSSSRPRRESSSSPTRNPEDPIDPNEERRERRSSTSKRGESTEPDDKDRHLGRQESLSSPTRNSEDPINFDAMINNQDKPIYGNNSNTIELKPPADIRSSAKAHTPVRKGSKLVMKESDIVQLQRDLSKLRPPTPAARNIEIRIGTSLNLFNKMSNNFEQCLVTCIYDDGTFDASNSNGDVYEHVDEQYIDPDSFKVAISRTPVQMHPSNDTNHNLENIFPFQQQNKNFVMYKTGTYVEVYYRDANAPSTSLGIWLSGIIVRKIAEEQYLVLLDQENFEGANNIECVYHISEIRKVNNHNVENSFEGGKHGFTDNNHNQLTYTPQISPHVLTNQTEGSMQSYPVRRAKTAPDNRNIINSTNMNLFSQTSTNFPIRISENINQPNEMLNTLVASDVNNPIQDQSEFGVVFKSHCVPMQWQPIIVFFQSAKYSSSNNNNMNNDLSHPTTTAIDALLQANSDIIVCPSCEHADFSNDIDNYQSVIHWYDNGPGDRASCLLYICYKADAPDVCPAKITFYIKSLIVCELYFHVITNTNSNISSAHIPTGTMFDHQSMPKKDYHKILKYSMEAKSTWEIVTAPMITSLYVLCIYDEDTINDKLLVDHMLAETLDAMPSHMIITITSESESINSNEVAIFDNHTRHTKYNRNIAYDKVQVMLFLQNRNSNLTMDWWKGLKNAHIPLADSLYSTGMTQRLIQAKQNKLAISVSMRGSILESGSYDNLRYEWLLNTLGIRARNVTSVSYLISLQRWCYHRGIQNDETISTSISIRTRFIRSQQLLYNLIQSFDVIGAPSGVLLLPTAAIIPSQKTSITKNNLLNAIRSNSKDKFEIQHNGALNEQHHAWELHLLCDGTYPLTATGAISIPISSLTSVIPVDIEASYLNLPFINSIIPLMKITIAMLIAHIAAASLNTPGLIFPGYITNISKLFDVQSLLELYNYYSELELTFISNRFNHIPHVIAKSSPNTTITALPTTFGTHTIIGTEDFEAALRCAVAYLEDTILSSMQQEIHKSVLSYNNFILTKSILNIEGGRVKQYDIDGSIYFSKVFASKTITMDTYDCCWKSLVDITIKSKQMSHVEGTIAWYEIDYRNFSIHNSEMQSSIMTIGNDFNDPNLINSPNQMINIHQKAIINSNKQKDLQSTLLQMLVNDIGIYDMIQAQEIVNCLISQGCSSYADFILLGSIFMNKVDGSVNNEQLRSLFHHSGIPLFIAAKLAAFIETKLK